MVVAGCTLHYENKFQQQDRNIMNITNITIGGRGAVFLHVWTIKCNNNSVHGTTAGVVKIKMCLIKHSYSSINYRRTMADNFNECSFINSICINKT